MNKETPKGWKKYKLKELYDINRGGSPRPIEKFLTTEPDGINWIKIGDAKIGSKYIEQTKEKITQEGASKSRFVEVGDFILSNSMSFGRPYIMKTRGCIHDGWLVLKEKQEGIVYKDFMYYMLSSNNVYSQFQNAAAGGVVSNLNIQRVENISVLIPPTIAEQQEIVQVLDTMSDIIRLREECISHAQDLIPALFQEMFGNPIKNDKKHEQIAIKNLGKVTTGATPPSAKENMFGGTIPFVTPGDLETGNCKYNRYLTEDGSKNSRLVRAGSTMVCCIGATIGKVDKAIVNSCFNQQINAVEWNKEIINDIYALYLFRLLAPLIKAKASNTTLPILNKGNFENILIPKPNMKLQEQFAQKAIEIESYIKEQQEELENAKQMFQSLLHHAFTGELTRHKFGGDANG